MIDLVRRQNVVVLLGKCKGIIGERHTHTAYGEMGRTRDFIFISITSICSYNRIYTKLFYFMFRVTDVFIRL